MAITYFTRNELDEFYEHAERALALNPNDATSLAALGEKMVFSGTFDRGVALVKKAASLNPHHPAWYNYSLSFYHYRKSEYDQAAVYARKGNIPEFFWTYIYQASSFAQSGQMSAAEAAAQNLLKLYPEFSTKVREELRKWNFLELDIEHLIVGLRKAGIEIPNEP